MDYELANHIPGTSVLTPELLSQVTPSARKRTVTGMSVAREVVNPAMMFWLSL